MSRVYAEIAWHETGEPPWAEWEMWREEEGKPSKWIGHGTAPSPAAALNAIQKALEGVGE